VLGRASFVNTTRCCAGKNISIRPTSSSEQSPRDEIPSRIRRKAEKSYWPFGLIRTLIYLTAIESLPHFPSKVLNEARLGVDVRKFVLLLGCFAASPLAAGETTLSGEAIKTTLGGSLLALDTPVGMTVSVRIHHDGLMSGEAGALGAVLGATTDRGRWWVANNQVCFKWFRWFDAEPRCATITLNGKRFSWRREDGDTGTGTIVEPGKPIEKPAVVVAQAKKPVAPQKPAAKKVEVSVALNLPKAEPHVQKTTKMKPAASHKKPSVAALPAAPQRSSASTAVAFHVPEPHPATRPKRPAKIAVASVKPEYFTSAKVTTTTKVAIAKVNIGEGKPFRVAGVDPSDVLNIRNGPSPEYETVGGIPPDSHGITITGACLNDWCPVKHRTLVGWVNRRYLAEETAEDASAAEIPNYWAAAP
jgi:Bacterial SH3 domain